MEIKLADGSTRNIASQGVAGTGLGLGIAGTALGLLGGGLGNLFNGVSSSNGGYVSQESFGLAQTIAAKDSEIAILKAQGDVDKKLVDVYTSINDKVNGLREDMYSRWENQAAINTQQAVYNATNTAGIACLQNQVAQLQEMTKLVIPITNVCPQPAVSTTPATS